MEVDNDDKKNRDQVEYSAFSTDPYAYIAEYYNKNPMNDDGVKCYIQRMTMGLVWDRERRDIGGEGKREIWQEVGLRDNQGCHYRPTTLGYGKFASLPER